MQRCKSVCIYILYPAGLPPDDSPHSQYTCEEAKMAWKRTSGNPGTAKLSKVAIILVFFYFAECAGGSCISYGHACWGGHGKRTDKTFEPQTSENILKSTPKWFLARLLQQQALRNPNGILINENENRDDPQIDTGTFTRKQDDLEIKGEDRDYKNAEYDSNASRNIRLYNLLRSSRN